MKSRGDSDDALIERLLRKDSLAFEVLYSRYTGAMYTTAVRMSGDSDTADDVVHDAWVRAVESLHRFERRSSLRTWLTAILINCLRERWREHRDEVSIESLGADFASSPLDTLRADPIDLEHAIAALPAGFRQVLILHDVEGFRHEEIATMLGIVPGTSKSQLARARQRVREMVTPAVIKGNQDNG